MAYITYNNKYEWQELEGQYFLTYKIINKFMQHGKKAIIEQTILAIRRHIKEQWNSAPKKTFFWLFEKIKPLFNLYPKRVGKQNRFVPSLLHKKRAIIMALKWFVQSIRSKNIPEKLKDRILYEIAYVLFNSRYSIIQRRNIYYILVFDNRQNVSFRWK